MKLNGWRRIAVVLCGAWVVGVVALSGYGISSHSESFFVGLTLPVGTVVSGEKATLPDGRVIPLNVAIQGKRVKPWEIKWDNEPSVPTETVVHWSRVLTYLAIPFFLWAMAEILTLLVGWIKGGFRASTP